MRKGSVVWWIAVCVVLGALESLAERGIEHVTGWNIPDSASGFVRAVVIGIAVGIIGFPDKKKAEERREDQSAAEQ